MRAGRLALAVLPALLCAAPLHAKNELCDRLRAFETAALDTAPDGRLSVVPRESDTPTPMIDEWHNPLTKKGK